MPKNVFLILGLSLLLLVGILDRVAYWYHLYFFIWWFDCLMHFLGGVAIAFLTAFLFYRFMRPEKIHSTAKQIFLVTLVPVILIGLIWEMVEFGQNRFETAKIHLGTVSRIEERLSDKTSDLAFDLLGGIYAGVILLLLRPKINKNGEES